MEESAALNKKGSLNVMAHIQNSNVQDINMHNVDYLTLAVHHNGFLHKTYWAN